VGAHTFIALVEEPGSPRHSSRPSGGGRDFQDRRWQPREKVRGGKVLRRYVQVSGHRSTIVGIRAESLIQRKLSHPLLR
jgi:hypothetical protein